MKFYRLSDETIFFFFFFFIMNETFYDCINTIYQFMKPLLDKKYVYF